MEKYEVIERAGSGNFSDVYKAKDLLTGQIVAIKQMKQCEDIEQLALRQLKILSTLSHPNIVQLKQVIMNQGDIKVVFEYVEENLLELYESSKTGINQNQIKCILYQTCFALDYLHTDKKIIHRDVKPENILIDRKKALIKLIDFGLAKEQHLASTDYVATRWYRSPENLIGLRKSTTAIDIFALACVIVQLFTLNPLFPGDNTMDQLHKVFNILGTPTQQSWPLGYYEMKKKGISILPRNKISLNQIMMNASQNLIDLLQDMLILNPEKRIKARQILNHPFFQRIQRVIPGVIFKEAMKYLQNFKEQKRKIPLMKSLSPTIAAVSKIKYSPKKQLYLQNQSIIHRQSLPKQINISKNKLNQLNIPTISSLNSNSNPIHFSTQSKIGYVTPTSRLNPVPNLMISPELRDGRLISLNYSSQFKKSPLPSKRDEQRYLGVDPIQLQNIKKKMNQNQGIASPKFNVKYFKQSQNYQKQRRNLSVGQAPRSRLIIHKINQLQPKTINPKIKNVFASKMNFRSN